MTSGHSPFDERIFYKFGLSILNAGYRVSIIASTKNVSGVYDGISVSGFDGKDFTKRKKVQYFDELLKVVAPQLVICSEPITIMAALRYRKQNRSLKIIYDVTEYYPHQNMLNQYTGIKRGVYFLLTSTLNFYLSNRIDHLIIGEILKTKPYKIFAPFKRRTIISYFPPKIFFKYNPPSYQGKTFTLCYTGVISKERGFTRFIELSKMVAQDFPQKLFILKIVGPFAAEEYQSLMNSISNIPNISVKYKEWVDYKLFSDELKGVDLCIDLRDKNKTYNKSLPIKIFDYMACGKPVIYSKLDSLSEITEISEFGLMIEPNHLIIAKERIAKYLTDAELLNTHSKRARQLFEENYNWEKIEPLLIDTVKNLINSN